MISIGLNELAAVLECKRPAQEVRVESIVTDSRKVHHGTLFAALSGNNVDGHDFAESAVKLGAAALLVERRLNLDISQLVVDDVLMSLGKLAAMLRDRIDPAVVGITGSNGKTTVKEMITSILALEGDVLATRGNYNNELGVPLSLFDIEAKHRYAVLEMGASKAGDIAYLAEIAKPDIGVITNIGPAHLQGFGSEEGAARAKGEIFASLPPQGCAVFNADEPWLPLWKEMNTAGNSITFGTATDSEIQLVEKAACPQIVTPHGTFDIELPLPGRHNLINATAATAVSLALGVELAVISQGLQSVNPVPGRLNLIKTASGWTVIDDTYNANPASLYSALQVLAGMQGKPWLVLGDMKELGQNSHKMHREVGEAAKAMGVRRLYTTGDLAANTADAFGLGAEHFESRDELAKALVSHLQPGVICLVKGSRSMGMEAIVESITRNSEMREAS